MTDQNKPEHVLSRRDALKTLAAATGATALATLPSRWETPALEVGSLPAFAQSSPTNAPFTSIAEVGQPGSGVTPNENRGWIVINVINGRPAPLSVSGAAIGQQSLSIIPPIFPDARHSLVGSISWASVSVYTLSYTFISINNVLPADGVELILYGVSGDLQYKATITATVVSGVVIFDFALPASYSGLFYFSANFVEETIILTNSVELDIRYYFSVGIYAERSVYIVFPADSPLITGSITLIAANDAGVCPGSIFNPPQPTPGSAFRITLNYIGGDVTQQNTIITTYSAYYPDGAFFLVPFNVDAVTATTITLDLCYHFGGNDWLYFLCWITDGNGANSNSVAGLYPITGLNSLNDQGG